MIFVAGAMAGLGVFARFQYPLFGECPEPRAQNAAAAIEGPRKIVKPAHAVDRLANHEQRPFLADHVERAANTAMPEVVEKPRMQRSRFPGT